MLDYQQALEQDSHYSNAVVQADFDNMENDHVPVLVKISEMKKQKLTFGLRYDSKNGPGFRGGYDYYDLFHKGFVGSTLLDTDRYETTFGLGISQPRNSRGHFWTSNLNYTHSTVQHLKSHALTSGIWYVRDRNGIDSRLVPPWGNWPLLRLCSVSGPMLDIIIRRKIKNMAPGFYVDSLVTFTPAIL